MPARGMALGGGGIVGVVFLLIYLLAGGDPGVLVNQGGGGGAGVADPAAQQADPELREFVGVVLADTEDVWNDMFAQELRREYPEPTLVLFTGQVDSACGFAGAATGPFYCPMDQKLYIDLSFFDELQNRFGAPGDFAMAYVVAHEVGHHVQTLLGLTQRVHAAQQQLGKAEGNEQSVRLELQADYLAGVWAHHAQQAKNILESGDVEEALNAANAIGDDRLQKQAQGYVVPDSFTHGSSAQRARWFRRGLQTGDFSGMDALFELPYEDL